MTVKTKTIEVASKADTDIINITDHAEKAVKESKLKDGILTIFVPGSTASISTIEYEPNLVADFKDAVERIAPSDIKYRHHETWDDHNGKSHVSATMMGPSMTIPFNDGKLILGTWQQIVLLDFDMPARKRKIVLQAMGE